MTDTTVTTPAPTSPGGPPSPHEASDQEDPRRWIALFSVLTASFMVLLDVSIVNVAIPSIRSNLAANNADVQFVIAGYGLAYAVLLITGGRLGDIFGRKRLFMIGMGGFIAASALCGLAQTAVMLDVSRVVQGLMAALMYPQVLSVIQVSFHPRERAKVFGLFGAIIGVATITGPLVGGLIIRDDITGGSWRWIFLVNLPIGLIALAVAARVVTESKAPHASRLDIVGVLIASVGLFLLVFPLVQGQSSGWPVWCFACLGVSPLVIAAFVLYERGLRPDQFPLVQLSLFRIRAFSIGLAITSVFIAGIPAFFFVFSLMLQVGLGFSALNAGLTTIPFSLGSAVASAMSVRVAPKLGKWTISVGSVLLTLGMVGIILTLHIQGTSINGFALIPAFLVSGLGLGTVIAPLLNIILAGVPGRDAGSASGLLTTFQQLGGAVGVAVIGVVFFGVLAGRADTVVAGVAPQLRSSLAAAQLPPGAIDSSVAQFTRCFHDRAAESDPAQVPPSCASATQANAPAPVTAAFTAAGTAARERDFVSTVERVLLINIGLWLLTAFLALFLPRLKVHPPGGTAAAA